MIKKLDHVNILSTRMDETLRFYKEIFEMEDAPPPGGTSDIGAWLYDKGGNPILHVQRVDPENAEKIFARIRNRIGDLRETLSLETLRGTGPIEHVALECTDYDRLLDKLETRGLPTRTYAVPSMDLRQIFVNDPNGILLELNFRGS